MNEPERRMFEAFHRFGHFQRVADVLAFDDVAKLNVDSPEAVAAAKSYQTMFHELLDDFCYMKHSRPADPNGEVGPATASLMEVPRCGESDFPTATAEEANWPVACRFAITTSYEPNMAPPGVSKDTWRQVWGHSNQNIMKAVKCSLYVNLEDYPRTRMFAKMATLPRGVLANHQLPRNNCVSRLQGLYNRRFTSTRQRLEAVATHEKVHGMGAPHTNAADALMNPYIHARSIARRGSLIEADMKLLTDRGYELATITEPEPSIAAERFSGTVDRIFPDGTKEPRHFTGVFLEL